GGASGSAEIVLDYNTGQASLVLSGGMSANNSLASAGVNTGFILGGTDAVKNYAAGGNSSATVAIPVPAELPTSLNFTGTANSGGITGNPVDIHPDSAAALTIGVSIGALNSFVPGSVGAQNTARIVPLGSFTSGGATAAALFGLGVVTAGDYAMTALHTTCSH